MNQIAIENFCINKSGWAKVKFGDVVFEPKESVKDPLAKDIKHVVGLEHIDSEDIHLRRSAGIEKSTTFTKRFAPRDVLFGRRRAYLKKAAQADFEGICSGDITVMRAKKSLIPGLLPFIVNNKKFFDYAITHSAGGLSPRVKFKYLADYELLLPPIEQQAELAELLWGIDQVVESDLKVQNQLNNESQILFQNLVDSSEGEVMPLSSILIPKKEKSQAPHEREKYIGLENISSAEYSCDNYESTSDVLAQCNLIDIGDLCYSKLRPYLDKAFIASFDAISTTELLVYDTKLASKQYVLYHLHSKPFIHYVSGKGFGTKMPRVNHEIIGKYDVKVLENEKQVLDKMSEFERAKKALSEKIRSSKMLYKSILNQVF